MMMALFAARGHAGAPALFMQEQAVHTNEGSPDKMTA